MRVKEAKDAKEWGGAEEEAHMFTPFPCCIRKHDEEKGWGGAVITPTAKTKIIWKKKGREEL